MNKNLNEKLMIETEQGHKTDEKSEMQNQKVQTKNCRKNFKLTTKKIDSLLEATP